MKRLFGGTTVLITGASSGIGAAFADGLAASGARLILTARNPERLAAVAARARAAGAAVDTIRLDLTSPGAVAALLREFETRNVTVDHLVNNAGIGAVGRGDEAPLDRQLRVVDLNVRAATELALRLLPGMVARGRGGLLNVASTAAFQGVPWLSVYGGSKAYILNWSEALHAELRGTGVRCCCLCPGPVATSWFASAGMNTPARAIVQTAAEVAEAGLRGYVRDKSHVISGPLSRTGTWLTRLVPRALAARIATGFARPRGSR